MRRVVPANLKAQRRCRKVVAIGGGTGLPVVLRALAGTPCGCGNVYGCDHLSAIVTMTDDGGSSGRLRREMGILPPGDIRNCITSLLAEDSYVADLLQHRLASRDALDGHPLGNLMLAALTQMSGSFGAAVRQLCGLLGVRGEVIPSTDSDVRLIGEFADGTVAHGETAIVGRRQPLRRVWLGEPAAAVPRAIAAIREADVIVVGPGSLFTSVVPNLLVTGIAAALGASPATKLYVANVMTQPGETDGFSVQQHVDVIEECLGPRFFDYVLVNDAPFGREAADTYAALGAEPIAAPAASVLNGATVISAALIREEANGKIRHSPEKLREALASLGRDCGDAAPLVALKGDFFEPLSATRWTKARKTGRKPSISASVGA